jgi:two-component system, sensor histidine kinase PdtaS
MKSIIIIISLFLVYNGYAQTTSKADSLKKELKHAENKADVLNQLARLYVENSPVESFNYATRAKEEALKSNDKNQLSEALWNMARYYLYVNDYNKSNLLVDSAKKLFHETKNNKSEINCIALKANILFLQGNYMESLKLFKISANESKKIGANDIYCSSTINIGRIYKTQGENDSALYYLKNVLVIAKEINNKFLEGSAYGFIGEVYKDQQKYDLAIDNYLAALSIFENQKIFTKIPYWQYLLGDVYREIGNYKESLKYCRTALKYFITSNDHWGLQEVYKILGNTYMEMNIVDSAWIYHKKSLKICKEIHEKAGESDELNFLAEILIQHKKYKEALDYLNEAFRLNTEVKSAPGKENILLNMGKCYVYMGLAKKGLDILTRSLKLADSLNLKTERMLIHKEISRAYSELGDYKEALIYHEAFTALSDSIFREESNRHFIEMEQKYQSEKKEKEISKLNLDKIKQDIMIKNQQSIRNILLFGFLFALIAGVFLYRSNQTKKKANKEKEALLKEIHHRVKNNLQIISSLLSIQTENVTDASVISAVKESQSRVKAMALIHQLLYQEKEFTRIDFSTYLPQLVHAVSSIFKREGDEIDVTIVASNIAFDIDTSIPLGLIITELISNAYKYAFDGSGKGRIKVELKQAVGNNYILSVADNGKGLSENLNIDEFISMGLRLVKMLTGQLDGTFDYHYDKGAIFTIKFADTI